MIGPPLRDLGDDFAPDLGVGPGATVATVEVGAAVEGVVAGLPNRRSSSAKPESRSLPLPPARRSLPLPPRIMFGAALPASVSLNREPVRFSMKAMVSRTPVESTATAPASRALRPA
jgi:hypothetical protein